MEKLIKDLIVVISKEIDAFNQLLQTLHEKQKAIVEGEIERLKRHVSAESQIVHKTKSLEAERMECTKELAKHLSLDDLNPRLGEIIEKVEETYAARLREQRNLLRSLIQKIQNLNESNQFLLNYSLQFIESSIRLLLNGNEEKLLYQKDGKVQEKTKSSKLLDHKI